MATIIDGALDESFGSSGRVPIPFAISSGSGLGISGTNIKLASDGGILFARASGASIVLSRYTASGKTMTFGTGGTGDGTIITQTAIDTFSQIAITKTNKYIVAVRSSSNFKVTLCRYNSNGIADNTFGITSGTNTGSKLTDVSFSNSGMSLAVDSQDRIIIAGRTAMGGGTGGENFMVARFLSDGTLDQNFGESGQAITNFSDSSEQPASIEVDAFDNIFVAGYMTDGSGGSPGGARNFALAKYTSLGILDTTFGDANPKTGKSVASFADKYADMVYSLAIDLTDRIVLAGISNNSSSIGRFALAMFMPNGILDNSFRNSGMFIELFDGFASVACSVKIDSDNRIIVGGGSQTSAAATSMEFTLVRYTSAGELDTTFGAASSGIIRTSTYGGLNTADYIKSIEIDHANKRIIAAVNTGVTSTTLTSYKFLSLESPTEPETPVVEKYPCFKKGTKILTDKGYKRIEKLKNGDRVKTYLNGYKPIVLIGNRDIVHNASNERIKHQLYKCVPSQYPEVFEDLVLTGCHSILVKKFASNAQEDSVRDFLGKICITENNYRLPASLDDRALVYESPGTYTIYHIALENDDYYMNYGIYANGLLVESCSKRYLKELSNMKLS